MNNIYSEIFIGTAAIISMYFFAKWISDRAFKQVEDANKMVVDSHKKFVDFIEDAYVKNVKVTEDLIIALKDYIKIREDIKIREGQKKNKYNTSDKEK